MSKANLFFWFLIFYAGSKAYAIDLGYSGFSYQDSAVNIENSEINQSAITGKVEAECDGFNSSCSNYIASISASGNVTIKGSKINQTAITGDVRAYCNGINCGAKNAISTVQAGR